MRMAVASMKDSGTSPSAVWERLFKVHYNRKGAKSASELNSIYVSRLARDVQTCGEYDKLMQGAFRPLPFFASKSQTSAGCFENYLSIRQPTDSWRSILKMHDWLALYDHLDKRMRNEHSFDLLAYTPYTFVPWYPHFASVGTKSFDWPKGDYEVCLLARLGGECSGHHRTTSNDRLIKRSPIRYRSRCPARSARYSQVTISPLSSHLSSSASSRLICDRCASHCVLDST